MKDINATFAEIKTGGYHDIVDLTPNVKKAVANSGIRNGLVVVMSLHTTFGILVNEKESGFFEDLRRTMRAIAPAEQDYVHDDLSVRTENLTDDERVNGHSHVQAAIFTRTSESFPILEGQIVLGRWQSILGIELDREDKRRVLIHVMGY